MKNATFWRHGCSRHRRLFSTNPAGRVVSRCGSPRRAKASQTLLQQPLAEGRDETTIQAGLTLLRWLNQQCQQVPEAGVRAALGDA